MQTCNSYVQHCPIVVIKVLPNTEVAFIEGLFFYQHKLFIWDLALNCSWQLFSGISAHKTTMLILYTNAVTHQYKTREGVWTWLDEPVLDECVQGNRLTQVS